MISPDVFSIEPWAVLLSQSYGSTCRPNREPRRTSPCGS